jgi:hypothetical protein
MPPSVAADEARLGLLADDLVAVRAADVCCPGGAAQAAGALVVSHSAGDFCHQVRQLGPAGGAAARLRLMAVSLKVAVPGNLVPAPLVLGG